MLVSNRTGESCRVYATIGRTDRASEAANAALHLRAFDTSTA